MQNLSGQGQATFRDGAIVGINVAGMVRNVTWHSRVAPREARETDFAELSGSFDIENGILTNNDLWLQAPVLRVAGSGQLNLPERTVNYRIEPRAAPTLEGQGGAREVAGLLVPVIVRGPWDDLTFAPDLESVARRALEDPEAMREQIEQLGQGAKAARRSRRPSEGARRTAGSPGRRRGREAPKAARAPMRRASS